MSSSRRRSPRTRRLAGLAALVLLVAGMLWSTKFLTPEEVKALNPPPFSAPAFVDEEFPKAQASFEQDAVDIATLAPAVEKDLASAGSDFGVNLGSGAYAFPVKASGTAAEVDANFVLLDVPDLPDKYQVRIPLGSALNGAPIRDAMGIKFGDFPDQTTYQTVANAFKAKTQKDVLSQVDPDTLRGKQVTVVGAWGTGGPPNSFIIQPVTIEVGS